MNWKTCFLPLLLAAAVLGSVTAFADGEPVTPETTEPTEIASRETEGSWDGDTYTDNQGIVYQLNGNFITVTGTSTNFSGGEITIPATIKKGMISYPVTSIGDIAFENCGALESVTFSSSVDSIGGGAFSGCKALESGTFPGDVGNIEHNAFERCSALTTLTFSGDVDSIESNAFAGCDALKTIYVPASTTEDTIDMIRKALTGSWLQNVQIVQPDQPSDPATDPSTPSVPSTGTPSTPSTGTTSTGSASAVQQLEAAERPDPMDEQATERYNFWMDVKSDLRAAGDGRTVRVYVPADYTNMPASVMETIRTLGKEITIDLRWNGQRLIITPQTALRRPALKAFWTFDALCEVYAR